MDPDALCTRRVLPRLMGPPSCAGRLRSQPEDFRVDELPAVQPSGTGSHLWLRIEKRGANTDWMAGQLAKAAGCSGKDVGYAGMKDRHAVTTQWFSVPALPDAEDAWKRWELPQATILEGRLHEKKLRRGVLRGNRFCLVIRELEGDGGELMARIESLRLRGVPNYFGPQRFGHEGGNVLRGARWLTGGGRLPRAKRSIYLSAVRSHLFNKVLARRVEQQSWDHLLGGEVVMLDGSHSVFVCDDPDPDAQRRCREFDIHPTGPLPGEGGLRPTGDAAALESEVLQPFAELLDGLVRARVEADRRSLRTPLRDLDGSLDRDQLTLRFSLPPGAYATTVIGELVRSIE